MRGTFWTGLMLGLLVGIGLGLVGARLGLVERWASWRAPAVPLQPAVTVSPGGLRLTNRDRFDWEGVELVLNARAPGEGYTLYVTRLQAGAQIELPLARFTAPDQQPFDPRTTKAFLLSLRANTPQGRGAWSGRLD
jgi:hypothetical protein